MAFGKTFLKDFALGYVYDYERFFLALFPVDHAQSHTKAKYYFLSNKN